MCLNVEDVDFESNLFAASHLLTLSCNFQAYTIVGDEVIGGRTQKYYSNSYQNAKFLTTSIENDIK